MVEISCDLSLIDNTTGREFETFIVKLFEKLGNSHIFYLTIQK